MRIRLRIPTKNSTKTKIKIRQFEVPNSLHTTSMTPYTRGMVDLLPEKTRHLSALLTEHDLEQWALQKRLYDARARLRGSRRAATAREAAAGAQA